MINLSIIRLKPKLTTENNPAKNLIFQLTLYLKHYNSILSFYIMMRDTVTHFNLDLLLTEISPEAPCGEDISYDITFMKLERLIQGSAENQVGNHVLEREEPDWKEVYNQSLKLLERSRDLRLIIYLTLSKLCLDGLPGFYDGLALLRGTVQRYWEPLFPQLDPDDDNDPMERMNIIASLSPLPSVMSDHDSLKFIPRLMDLPLCRPADGRLPHPSLRHILFASGEITAAKNAETDFHSTELIDAAFEQADILELQDTNKVLHRCVEHLQVLDQMLINFVGTGIAPNFNRLERVLKQMHTKTGMYLERRGYGQKKSLLMKTQDKIKTYFSDKQFQSDEPQMDVNKMEPAEDKPLNQKFSGQITSNQDVVKALDMIIVFYEQNEPSSPVPLLLKRAKRLVGRSFVDIIRNLSPDALSQVQMISGSEESGDN